MEQLAQGHGTGPLSPDLDTGVPLPGVPFPVLLPSPRSRVGPLTLTPRVYLCVRVCLLSAWPGRPLLGKVLPDTWKSQSGHFRRSSETLNIKYLEFVSF